jgi:hypothetical protein
MRFLFEALKSVIGEYQQNVNGELRLLYESKLAYIIDLVNETLVLGFPSTKRQIGTYPSQEEKMGNGTAQPQCFDFQICGCILFIFNITNQNVQQ